MAAVHNRLTNTEKRKLLEDLVWELRRKLHAPQLDRWSGMTTVEARRQIANQNAEAMRLYREFMR